LVRGVGHELNGTQLDVHALGVFLDEVTADAASV
jgi:hypothetical protein